MTELWRLRAPLSCSFYVGHIRYPRFLEQITGQPAPNLGSLVAAAESDLMKLKASFYLDLIPPPRHEFPLKSCPSHPLPSSIFSGFIIIPCPSVRPKFSICGTIWRPGIASERGEPDQTHHRRLQHSRPPIHVCLFSVFFGAPTLSYATKNLRRRRHRAVSEERSVNGPLLKHLPLRPSARLFVYVPRAQEFHSAGADEPVSSPSIPSRN